MKFVPEAECEARHKRAMDATNGAGLHSQIELFIEVREVQRLAQLVRSVTDKLSKMSVTMPPVRPPRRWKKRIRDWLPGCGAHKGCVSSMPGKASITTRR